MGEAKGSHRLGVMQEVLEKLKQQLHGSHGLVPCVNTSPREAVLWAGRGDSPS